jgi:hypothetical protein
MFIVISVCRKLHQNRTAPKCLVEKGLTSGKEQKDPEDAEAAQN